MLRLDRDTNWSTVQDFIQTHLQPGDRLFAPKDFQSAFSDVTPYGAISAADANQFQWIVLHKGKLSDLDSRFLERIIATMAPVFANPVFVVFSTHSHLARERADSPHLRSLWQHIDPSLNPNSIAPAGDRSGLVHRLKGIKHWLSGQPASHQRSLDAILSRLTKLEKDVQKFRKEVNRRTTLIRDNQAIASMTLEEFKIACRSACQTAYLGNDMILCRVLGKHLLYADSQDVGLAPRLCLNGNWEADITLAMARVLQPGWACLDVGANHGYFTVLMAEAVGDSGRVVALEPNPKLAGLMQRTLEVNGFQRYASVERLAASAQPGETVKLSIPHGQGGHASITLTAIAADVIEVKTTTIDQLTADWSQVNLIKIDAEGAEYLIWQGMRETIRRNPNVIILLEFSGDRYANSREFLDEIQAEGFPLRYVDTDADIKPITPERCLVDEPDRIWMLFLQRSP